MTLLCGPRCAVYLPGPVSNKPLFSQSFRMVIAEGRLAILTGTTRAGPATIVVIDRLRPAQKHTPLAGGAGGGSFCRRSTLSTLVHALAFLLLPTIRACTHVDTRTHVHARTHTVIPSMYVCCVGSFTVSYFCLLKRFYTES